MTVGILIVTHDDVGQSLLDTATSMLGLCPMRVNILAVHRGDDSERLLSGARRMVRELDQGNGVLVLTDMFGSTPSNIASAVVETKRVRAISGMNLPMLVRILNYPKLSLDELVIKAVDGAREGVLTWSGDDKR